VSHSSSPSSSSPVDDPQCWEAIHTRDDEAAFEALYLTYRTPLFRQASHYVSTPELAIDIVHDVFAKLWLMRKQLVIKTHMAAYLSRAVRNAALNARSRDATARRHAESAITDDDAVTLPPDDLDRRDPDVADDDTQQQLMQTIAQAMALLPARQRAVADLRWREGLDRTTIARRLSITPATVNSLLTTAMRTIRARIGAAQSRRAS
jgi:RNA polymerase sigma factor (sigma-70 family)